MKKFLNEVHKVVSSLLREGVCPGCGDKRAYIGMSEVECPNRKCSNFSMKQLQDVDPAAAASSGDFIEIDLDWAWDELDNFEALCKKHGVTGSVVTMNGPAGGNPAVIVKGPVDSVRDLVMAYTGDDEEETEFLMSAGTHETN